MIRLGKAQWYAIGGLATIALVVLAIGGGIWVTHTQRAQIGNTQARCQSTQPAGHQLVIKNNHFVPVHLSTHLCEMLTITNKDFIEREIAFGPHAHHISYDGVSERLLLQNQSLTIRLVRAGTFLVHDHDDAAVHATFTVTP